MKPAKAEYYNPKLKGKQDGQDMEDLPPIAPRSPLNVSPRHVRPTAAIGNPPKRVPQTPPTRAENQKRNPLRDHPVAHSGIPHILTNMHASQQDSTLAGKQDDMLEEIRKTVKAQGKEVTYVRLTQEEKNQLADIVYSYKRQGVRTTETEISRIAINYLIEEYQANGQASILARLLVLLNA